MAIYREGNTFIGEASRPLKVDDSFLKMGESYSIFGGYIYATSILDINEEGKDIRDYGIAKMSLMEASSAVHSFVAVVTVISTVLTF